MAGMRLKGFIGLTAAAAMLASSTGAVASGTSATAQQISPWATLTVLTGGVSAAAVCGTAAAAAVAAQPASGCVLPVMDVPPPVPVASAPPVPVAPIAAPAAGFGISPLLIGLVAIAAAAGLYFSVKGNGHHEQPISPT